VRLLEPPTIRAERPSALSAERRRRKFELFTVPARRPRVRFVSATPPSVSRAKTQTCNMQAICRSPLTDSNRRPPPYHGGALPTELRGRSAIVGGDSSARGRPSRSGADVPPSRASGPRPRSGPAMSSSSSTATTRTKSPSPARHTTRLPTPGAASPHYPSAPKARSRSGTARRSCSSAEAPGSAADTRSIPRRTAGASSLRASSPASRCPRSGPGSA
jgi:hypothetical protein